MKHVFLCLMALLIIMPSVASADLAPSQFTITPGMTKEQQLVVLRAHVEYLTQLLVTLQSQTTTGYVATVDYTTGTTTVKRQGSGAVVVQVPSSVATTSIAREIAKVTKERESEAATKLTFEYIGADVITTYLVKITSPYSITLEKVQANGVVVSDKVSRESIDDLITGTFFGNKRVYEQVLGAYVTDIKRNRVAPELTGIAATLFGVSENDVAGKLQFEVKGYKR